MKKLVTLMLVCLIGLTAMAGKRHNVTVVSANDNLQFKVYVNDTPKHKDPSKHVVLTNMKPAKDYKVRVNFDNIKIMHPNAELTLTNVTEDMELVAFIEGQQAYLVTRADYDAIQQAKKAKHSCGHNCGHNCGSAKGGNHADCSKVAPANKPDAIKAVKKK